MNNNIFEKWFIDGTHKLNMDYVRTIPEFLKLEECQQSQKWHGEGNAMVHTMNVVDEMYKLIEKCNSDRLWYNRILVLSALLHDIGKGVTTEFFKNDWHSYNHEIEGEKIARKLLWDEDFTAREIVCSNIRWHMERCGLDRCSDIFKKCLKLAYDADMSFLYYVMLADIRGSKTENPQQDDKDISIINTINKYAKVQAIDGVNELEVRDHIFNGKALWQSHRDLPIIYVMIGLPGSGKDTFIKNNFQGNPVILCRDDIRVELGYCKKGEKIVGSRDQEEAVTKVFNERLLEAVEEGENIILNNINLKKKYRDAIKKLIGKKKYMWVYEYIEAPTLQDNIDRRKGQIKPEIFEQMILNFDYPTNEEYNLLFINKQSKNE